MTRIVVLSLALCASSLFAQRTTHTIISGTDRIDINCTGMQNNAFVKEGQITSTVPIRILFMKNDKSEVDISGKDVRWAFKKSERGEDVADVQVDGKNWWSTRCIYFVTAYVRGRDISFNGEKMRINDYIDLSKQIQFPFTVSTANITAAN